MILSVSRRTDIPNYYSEWFINRIREGYLYVRNPMNPHQISRINLSPQVVDCIVFWTKNPLPIMDRLDEFKEYPFYFQFTLTCYGKDIEPGLPEKNTRMTDIFRLLSSKTGMEKVVWRYDPILFTNKYTPEYHLKAFQEMAEALRGYTEKVVISFVDFYAKSIQNMKRIHVVTLEQSRLLKFASQLSIIAAKNGMKITSCAENMDLTSWGIESGCCIDRALIERITGCRIDAKKDRNQRKECGCMESIEVGTYDTCRNGCIYCYANSSDEKIRTKCRLYDPESPLLCGVIGQEDKITERKVKSLRQYDSQQLSLYFAEEGITAGYDD